MERRPMDGSGGEAEINGWGAERAVDGGGDEWTGEMESSVAELFFLRSKFTRGGMMLFQNKGIFGVGGIASVMIPWAVSASFEIRALQ